MLDFTVKEYLSNIEAVEAIDHAWFTEQIKIHQQHTNNPRKPCQQDMQAMLLHWNFSEDTAVYGWPAYIIEAWSCWRGYSRRYIRDLINRNLLSATSIADLGCGFAMTTTAIKTHCPTATVTATNVPDTLQWRVAQHLGKKYNFTVTARPVGKYELVFASEYFEHIKRPVEHLVDIITENTPDKFIIANSFGTQAVGHYQEYQHENVTLTARQTSKLFNKTLEQHGYQQLKVGLWNNRPRIWVKP